MKQMLGRKQTSHNADWSYAMAHIEELISQEEVKEQPAEIFTRTADIGRRRLTYWNIDEKFHLGGTSYLLLRGYVADCLRQCGIRDAKITGRLQASPEQMAAAIRAGSALVLGMTHHRCYSSHLVVAYGTVRVAAAGHHAPRLYLLVADGWTARPRYIAADSLRLCCYVAVRV